MDAEKELDRRLDNIGERVAKLEGKLNSEKPKGFLKRISEFGGVVALGLSIIIASFTVYDKVYLEPKGEQELAKKELRENLNILADLSVRVTSLDWENNRDKAQAQMNSLTPRRINLIEQIEKSHHEFNGIVKFSDYLLLAQENELFGRYQKALEHVNKALLVSSNSMEKANAYWRIARLNGLLNNFDVMREEFTKAINEFNTSGFTKNAMQVLQLYIQWVGFELAYSKECHRANDVFQNLLSNYNRPEVWPNTKKEAQRQFKVMLSQVPRSCNLLLE